MVSIHLYITKSESKKKLTGHFPRHQKHPLQNRQQKKLLKRLLSNHIRSAVPDEYKSPVMEQ